MPIEEVQGEDEQAEFTTVMVFNFPLQLQLDGFVEALATLGFGDKYDFVSIIMRGRPAQSCDNIGYGFINFEEVEDAWAFMHSVQYLRFKGVEQDRLPGAAIAKRQGFIDCTNMSRKAITKGSMRAVFMCRF